MVRSLFADHAFLLSLEPEELGGHILEFLNSLPKAELDKVTTESVTLHINPAEYPPQFREETIHAFLEAWHWLDREGLIIRKPFSKAFFISRRGAKLGTHFDVKAYVASKSVPSGLLHPQILRRVWSAVVRADYESAVFSAIREVEIAVRGAAGLEASDVGTGLMRKTFDKELGPLTRRSEPDAEREALSHLFAGAIGRYKNPSSHRSVEYTLLETTDLLVLASHLLRIVDERKTGTRP